MAGASDEETPTKTLIEMKGGDDSLPAAVFLIDSNRPRVAQCPVIFILLSTCVQIALPKGKGGCVGMGLEDSERHKLGDLGLRGGGSSELQGRGGCSRKKKMAFCSVCSRFNKNHWRCVLFLAIGPWFAYVWGVELGGQ